jgi:hypothetical protein
VDPTPGGSQDTYIYADGSSRYKTRGEIANPNNYLIVPANYTEQQVRDFAAEIVRAMRQSAAGQIQAVGRMKESFEQNGPQDLQRNPQWGIPENSVVPAFVSSASYHFGSVTRKAGVPRELAERGGGAYNWLNANLWQPWEEWYRGSSTKIDTGGTRGLSRRNQDNFSKGYSDADVPRNGPSPMNDFGYNTQAPYPPGQIGDGNGLGVGDWRFALAGADPSNPMRPVAPLQTDRQPAPRLVRVSPNPLPAAPTSPVAPSNNRSSLGDRFGKWGSVPTGIAAPPASDRPESFDNRFGKWASVPVGRFGDNGSPVLRVPEKYRRSAAPDGPAPTSAQGALPATSASQPYTAGTGGVLGKFFLDSLITPAEAASPPAQGAPLLTPYFPGQGSAFGDRSGNAAGVPSSDTPLRRISSAFPGITPPDPVPPSQPGRALGIFTGKPMPSWTTPPPLDGLLNNSSASGNGDPVDFLAGLALRNPTPPEPPQQTADSKPERRLGRSTYSVSPASAFDTGAPAVPFVSSGDANYSGGLLGMFAALAGSDPNQPAPADDEQEQADLQTLEARLSSSGNINDAWALYNARKSSRR